MDEVMRMKQALSDLVMESLMLGLTGGHITEEEFLVYMQEAQDIMNDTTNQFRQLGTLMIEQRLRKGGSNE